MARDENPPFQRGETFYNGETIDANDLGGTQLEGAEWVFEDIDPDTGIQRTERPVRCRIVRNTAATALLGGRLVQYEAGAGEYGARVDGYATTTAVACAPLDEYLPSGGVPVNDLAWVVIEGPAEVTVTLAAGATSNFSVGDWMVAATAATSGATTAGRAEQQVLTGATQPLADQIQNRIGRALTARTTANTGSTVLVDVGKW